MSVKSIFRATNILPTHRFIFRRNRSYHLQTPFRSTVIVNVHIIPCVALHKDWASFFQLPSSYSLYEQRYFTENRSIVLWDSSLYASYVSQTFSIGSYLDSIFNVFYSCNIFWKYNLQLGEKIKDSVVKRRNQVIPFHVNT